MAQQLVENLGLVGLFLAAFIAASLLPFPVEAAVPVVLELGHDPMAIVIVGAVGGYLGSLVNYALARRGMDWWRERHPDKVARFERIEAVVLRRGTPALFFSWLPVFGELVTMAAGAAHIGLLKFSTWTLTGRVIRMLALVQISWWIL